MHDRMVSGFRALAAVGLGFVLAILAVDLLGMRNKGQFPELGQQLLTGQIELRMWQTPVMFLIALVMAASILLDNFSARRRRIPDELPTAKPPRRPTRDDIYPVWLREEAKLAETTAEARPTERPSNDSSEHSASCSVCERCDSSVMTVTSHSGLLHSSSICLRCLKNLLLLEERNGGPARRREEAGAKGRQSVTS